MTQLLVRKYQVIFYGIIRVVRTFLWLQNKIRPIKYDNCT